MRGTKARAIRKAQAVCAHVPQTGVTRARKQRRYARCSLCEAKYNHLVPVRK